MGEAGSPFPPHTISILPLTCSSYLGQTGDAGRKTRTQQREGIPSDVSPEELGCCGRAVSGNHPAASAHVSPSVAATQVRAQPGRGRATRRGSAGTRRRLLGFGQRLDLAGTPLPRCPGGCDTGRAQGTLGEGCTDVPSLAGRSGQSLPGVRDSAGSRPGSAPRSLLSPSVPAVQPVAPRHRQTPDTAAPSLASAAGPAPLAAATQRAARPAGRR